MPKVIIMRGIPGAGKSTFVRENYPDATICSADNYFMVDGLYQFNAQHLGEAHGLCLRQFMKAIERHEPIIVVDNTNISATEIAPYAAIALAHHYELEIITLNINPDAAYVRNVHNVPLKTCLNGSRRLDQEAGRFPRRWHHITYLQK